MGSALSLMPVVVVSALFAEAAAEGQKLLAPEAAHNTVDTSVSLREDGALGVEVEEERYPFVEAVRAEAVGAIEKVLSYGRGRVKGQRSPGMSLRGGGTAKVASRKFASLASLRETLTETLSTIAGTESEITIIKKAIAADKKVVRQKWIAPFELNKAYPSKDPANYVGKEIAPQLEAERLMEGNMRDVAFKQSTWSLKKNRDQLVDSKKDLANAIRRLKEDVRMYFEGDEFDKLFRPSQSSGAHSTGTYDALVKRFGVLEVAAMIELSRSSGISARAGKMVEDLQKQQFFRWRILRIFSPKDVLVHLAGINGDGVLPLAMGTSIAARYSKYLTTASKMRKSVFSPGQIKS
uniref:Uncharacterized protein n=1 Tax=Peronospora matthiolae TaxID=2874970 RepID=A0AAV1TQU0_9STRA